MLRQAAVGFSIPFNRTSLELKHYTLDGDAPSDLAFNRTSLELKPHHVQRFKVRTFLLIEPVWN